MSLWNWFGSKKLKECEEKVRLEPENPQCYFELGTEYEQRGQYDKAIESFQQTLKLSSRSAETHFNAILFSAKRQPAQPLISASLSY
jgi:tetratricopeptide (TPR) repeat protein